MSIGRDALELLLDDRQSVAAAGRIDKAVQAIGTHASQTARQFDAAFDKSFERLKASARGAGDYVKRQFGQIWSTFKGNILPTSLGVFGGNLLTGAFRSVLAGITDVLNGAKDFFAFAIEKGIVLADSQRFLASVTKEVGLSFDVTSGQAGKFARTFGTSLAQASRLIGQSHLSVQGLNVDPTQFLSRFADLAASRGLRQDTLSDMMKMLFTSDDATDKLFGGKNPSIIWQEYAESIGRTAGSLTYLEQKQAIVNLVLQKGAENAGAASGRLNTFGGLVDQIGALFEDFSAKLGIALTRNEGLMKFLGGVRDTFIDLLSRKDLFDQFLQGLGDGFVWLGEAVIPIAAKIARFAIAFGDMFRDTGRPLDIFALSVFQHIEWIVENAKILVVQGVQAIMKAIEGAAIASGNPFWKPFIAGVAGADAFLDQTVKGLQDNLDLRQKTRGDEIYRLTDELVKNNSTSQGAYRFIDDLEKKALDSLPAFKKWGKEGPMGQFGDAAALATKEVTVLTDAITAAQGAALKLGTELLGVLDKRGELAELRFNAEQAQYGGTGSYSTTQKIQDVLQNASSFMEGLSAAVTSSLIVSGDSLAGAVSAAAEQPDDFAARRAQADDYLFSKLKGFSAADLTAAGASSEWLDLLSRRSKDLDDEADSDRRALRDTLQAVDKNQAALSGLISGLRHSGVTVPDVARFLKRGAEGIKALVDIDITADRDFGVTAQDGSPIDRTNAR